MKTSGPACTAIAVSLAAAAACTTVSAATVTYAIDPDHTYPSFEADHMGVSVWRGKFNKTSGSMTLDKAAGTGEVDVVIDMDSVDFGHEAMNQQAKADTFFDTAKHPRATYKGRLENFAAGVPTRISGDLTLHGVTKPVALDVKSFRCIPHLLLKRELCGADALATFRRDEFGLEAGKDYGFDMSVTLRIQVEAIQAEAE
jgi:polyisoprenoid-binding protein YceI